ncbi:hypothetical protein WN944_015362 [Citrus x changshan-huyou]|uniref:Uncharacterized protein n=1 Tax=Citrus x changshan-huyou TaxID=2935761 RepID=A0AAP0QLQ0_9ROSI
MDPKGARELFDGQAHLYNLTFNYVNSMAVKCAMELGMADKIHSPARPITLSDLASALEIQPAKTIGLRRLMRLLVHSGLFSAAKVDGATQEQEEEAYGLTPSSTLLVKDHPNSVAPYVLLSLNSITSFNSLSKWFKGNELTAYETTFGMNLWDYMEKNPEIATMFNKAMESDSEMANLVVKDCKPIFEGIGSLVDVGGGTGTFCRIICETFPGIKCTVFDLPHVVANLPETENLKFVGGDMLAQPIPPADAILLKVCFRHL